MVAGYNLTEGKPPFHPKYLAALWLYGMANRVRSSRMLESACHNRIDFRWLMEGQTPDHSTICGFVKRHRKSLKNLLKATLDVALGADLLQVNHIAVDGSKVEASAGKDSMKGRPTLEKKLKEIEGAVDQSIGEWDENEARDAGMPEAPWTPRRRMLSGQPRDGRRSSRRHSRPWRSASSNTRSLEHEKAPLRQPRRLTPTPG